MDTTQYPERVNHQRGSKQMFNSVKSSFRQYATFYGRETRRTFLEFFFFQVIVSILVSVIVVLSFGASGVAVSQASAGQSFDGWSLLFASFWGLFGLGILFLHSIFLLASLVPTLALQARRLHDANISAWWLFLHLAPFGGLALFIMNCLGSVNGVSRFENEGRPANSGSMQTGSFGNSGKPGSDW
jgi:uncharacterized membrane protein YhaH (DUF805 family)